MKPILPTFLLLSLFFGASINDVDAQQNQPPTAHIDVIRPASPTEGDLIRFKGHGTDPDSPNDRVVGFEWRSSIDGQLSLSRAFVTQNLSSGIHTIFFRVKDMHGAWSEETMHTLVVEQLTHGDGDWDYSTNNPDMFAIPSGNVGIGTEEPTSKLDVRGEIISLVDSDEYGLRGVRIGADAERGLIEGTQKEESYWLARDLVLNPHPFARVGIGASAPEAKLHVYGGKVDPTLNVDDTLYVDSRRVGIGTISPENKLHVNGAINLDPISEPDAPTTGFILYVDSVDGDLKAKSSTGGVTVLANP